MFTRSYLPDFLLASVAIGVALVLATILLVINYSPGVKASELLESNCRGENSFYLPTELYTEEQISFSKNAKAFSFLSSNGGWMRVVTDVNVSNDLSNASYTVTFKSTSDEKIDLSDSSVILEFSDGAVHNLMEGKTNQTRSASIVTVEGERSIEDMNLNAQLIIEKAGGGKCQGKIPNAIVISSDTSRSVSESGVKIVKGNQSGEHYFPKGYTPIGFASWRYLKPFTDAGLTIFKFDQSSQGWLLNPQNATYFAEPGIGYLVYNPNKEVAKVNSPSPYFVPATVENHIVSQGWNLLYNDTGNDTYAGNISLQLSSVDQPSRSFRKTTFSLQELIENDQADKDILYLPKGYTGTENSYEGVDISEDNYSTIIPDASFFWVYIYDDTNSRKIQDTPFSVELIGGGDTFGQNQYIQFEEVVTNNGDSEVVLPDGSETDHCLVGLEFYDADGNKIESDFDTRKCPLWPKTTTLEPGNNITYNYSWKPGEEVEGEITVRSYFDYTRLGASDMMYNEVKVNIK